MPQPGATVRRHERARPAAVSSDGILRAGEDVDRQILRYARPMRAAVDAHETRGEVDEGLRRGGEAAARVVDVLVDLGCVAREPVELRARGRERLVEAAEAQLLEKGARAPRSAPPPFEACDEMPEACQEPAAGVGAGQRDGDDAVAVGREIVLHRERPEAVREQHATYVGQHRRHVPIHRVEVLDHACEPVAVREVAEVVLAGHRLAVAAVVAREDRVARARQHLREPVVAARMLRQAVRDLHRSADRARRPRPRVEGDRRAVVARETADLVGHAASGQRRRRPLRTSSRMAAVAAT